MRSKKQILEAEGEFCDKVWYDRKGSLIQNVVHRKTDLPPDDILKGMYKAMDETEKKYGKENLGPYDSFEWGMINGKLSALRWVMGEDWDMLDT